MWLSGKESSSSDLWIRKWQPTPVFLPGEFHGQRSLAGYSLWGRRVGRDWATSLCLSLLQEIFPTQRSNPGLPHCRWILHQLSHKGSPRILEWVAYPFSSGSSQPRNQTRVSFIVSGFFTDWAIKLVPNYRSSSKNSAVFLDVFVSKRSFSNPWKRQFWLMNWQEALGRKRIY